MSTKLEQISPETIKLIENQARASGLSADEYLRQLLPRDEQELALKADLTEDEFEKDMTVFAEGTDDPPSYNGTYSRDDIYLDHN